MKVLTFSACPYLMTKLGRIHRDILSYLHDNDVEVVTSAWDVDFSWFTPNEDNTLDFEKGDVCISKIYPINKLDMGSTGSTLYDIIQHHKPDVILSIGNEREVAAVQALRGVMDEKIPWVNLLTIDSLPINPRFQEVVENGEFIGVINNKDAFNELVKINSEIEYIEYGADDAFCKNKERESDKLKVIINAKNSTANNLASLIMAVNKANDDIPIEGMLYTNYEDQGEYDLDNLLAQYDVNDCISMPESFVGLNDGLSDEELNDLYNEYDVIVDVSVRSATALTLLEGISSGCVPVTLGENAMSVVADCLPEDMVVSSVPYIGLMEKRCQIASVDSLCEAFKFVFKEKQDGNLNSIRESLNKIKWKKKDFLDKVGNVVNGVSENTTKNTDSIKIENFS